MEKQKKLIHKGEWDTLIVLDACRYDYFKDMYGEYIKGDLKSAQSPASCTLPWLKRTWQGYFEDVVYVAGNPFVNSYGYNQEGWEPKKHFRGIVDSWDFAYGRGTAFLPPEKVGKDTRLVKIRNPERKIVVHFMQPHTPYFIYRHTCEKPKSLGEPVKEGKYGGNKFRRKVKDGIVKIFGFRIAQRIIMGLWNLGIGEKAPMWKYAERYGKSGMRYGYRKNLERALKEIEKLRDRLPGEIIVTSDHGEFLGEGSIWGHNHYSNHAILRKVPWCVTRN